MQIFRRLTVWQKAHELALATFRISEGIGGRQFPGLASQLRRAAFAVPARIAEGAARESPERFMHFLELAIAGAREVDYFVLLAADLEAITRSDQAKLEARSDQVVRMLVALRATIRRRTGKGGSSSRRSRGGAHASARRPPAPST